MIRGVPTAFAFLTRLPIPAGATTDRDLGDAVAFFPLVGLVLGAIVATSGYLMAGHLPALMSAVLLVGMLAALTGGLHLDGVADLFDGLGGGQGERERTLAIMRDSHIGAHGAAALILVLLAKVTAVAALLDQGNFRALLLVPVIARWAVTPQMAWFPYARADGLGRGFRSATRPRHLIIATIITGAVMVGSAIPSGLSRDVITSPQAGVALFLSLAMGVWLTKRLGGLTGDVYGATIELCETGALFVASLG